MGEELLSSFPDSDEMNFFIKGRFKAGTQNLFGILSIQFDQNGDILNNHIVITSFSDIYNISIDDSWKKFEDTVTQYKWKGTYNTSLTNSLYAQLEKLKQDTSYNEQLFSFVSSSDDSGVNVSIYDLLNRILHDKQLLLDTRIERVSRDQVLEIKMKKSAYEAEHKAESSKTPSFAYGKDAQVISASPILSPVKGKPIYELRIGDRIMIKPDASNQTAQHFIELYHLRLDNRVKPVPAEIVDIKADSKTSPIEIICRINQNYYAKCFEDERQVKLRIYDPRIDGIYNFDSQIQQRRKDNSSNSGTDSSISPTAIALIGAAFFIILVLVILIYLML
ncbi:MAG: hypothetical protein KA015_03915 [Spirochaetes bacterium]|nr:hypothetical protein [Spirochaetota bacterium]